MLIAGLMATATVGTLSGAAYYLIIKEDRKKMKQSLRAYLQEPFLHFSYEKHANYYVLTPPSMEKVTKVKIKENDTTISCVFYLQFLQDLIPIYSFKYNKERFEIYDVREEYFFSPNKGKEIQALTDSFNQFIINGDWKTKVALTKTTEENPKESAKGYIKRQKETDTDIQYHLDEIKRKIHWLETIRTLEVEDSHKIDVLKQDANKIITAYHSFRDETKIAFKEKAIEAFIEIESKLNELSIQQEERIISDMEKTISLIKKR